MSDTVIRVENIGKKYIIGHQKQEPYTALRDVIADKVKYFGSRLLKPLGKSITNPAYEEFWALNDVSFEIKQGDRVGIIGRNGAGKSTLLKILSRIADPTKGRMAIKGRVASLLEVGTGFHPELTGRENIYLNGAILGMSKTEIRRKFDDIVAFAEVEKFLDTPVKRYSSGMYVRLAFAVAAHLEPEILVVDEVLSVGDAEFQKKCLGKMEVVGKEGRTVLFVSHNMESIIRLCSKGLYLEKGRLIEQGDIQTVTNCYLSKASIGKEREIDVSKKARPEYVVASSFKLKKIRLIGGDEFICYKIGEQIKIEISYECQAVIDGLRIGVGINTCMGQRLCTFHTDSISNFIKPNSDKIYLEFDTSQLTPGIYTIDFGARSGKVTYDVIFEVFSFEIAPFNTHNSPYDEDNMGIVSIKHMFYA